MNQYLSLKDKQNNFSIIPNYDKFTIDGVDELNKLLISLRKKKYIFRGIREAKFKIFSSIQRSYQTGQINKSISINQFVDKEIDFLRKNTMLKDYFLACQLPETNDLLYASFLQHYSAPTPLIDFTHSLNTALFFATDNMVYAPPATDIDDYFSLYMIDLEQWTNKYSLKDKLKEYLVKELVLSYKPNDNSNKDNNKYNNKIGISWVKNLSEIYESIGLFSCFDKNGRLNNRSRQTPFDIIKALYSFSQNKSNKLPKEVLKYIDNMICMVNHNIVAQKGCFILYAPDINEICIPLEDVCKNQNIEIYCVNIHKSLAPYVKNFIKSICRDSVYPDMIKLAQNAFGHALINI